MKKLLIVALVLILGLALLAGCQQPQKPEGGEAPKPPAQPGEAPTNKPGEPPAPPAEGADQIPYLHGVVVMGSVNKEAKGPECTEFAEMKFPGDVKVIALKIDKNPEAPKGKDVEVAFFFQDKKEAVKKELIKSDVLIEGEQFVILNPEKEGFAPGPYRVEIMEVGTPDKKNSIGFSVEGAAPAPAPGDAKPGDAAPAPGDAAPAPGDVKAPAPGDAAPAPGDMKAPAPGDAAPAPGDAAPAPGEEKKDEPKEEGDK